jgi:TonB-dependent receptor
MKNILLMGGAVAALMLAAAPAAAETNNGGSTAVEAVVVTAPRVEVQARARQEAAPTIIAVQSAETISKYPDYNAAEALGRIPGVSLSTDTGEGRFVNIRGIDANLNGATYGGVVLLNTYPAGTAASGGGRAVEFDTIPTGAIDGIVLYKTLSPDREAEGLGGQIELTPRSAKNISRPFLEGDLGWGYENLHKHAGPLTAAIAAGVRFGFNNGKLRVEGVDGDPGVASGWITNSTPFSIVVTASKKDDRRGVDDIEPSYANDGAVAVDNAFGEVDFRRYDYNRRRFGYGTELGFTPNDDHSYYARFDVAGYVESVQKNHFYAVFDGNPVVNPADPKGGFIDTFQPRVFNDHSQETHRNTVIAVGGSDRFNQLTVDYRAAYSKATYVEDFYREALWYGPKGLYGTYNATNTDHLVFNLFNDAALKSPFNSANAAQYSNPRLRQFYENDYDQEYSYVLNATYPVHGFGDNGQFKFGASARMRDKVVTDFFAQTKPTANLASYAASTGAGGDYYLGRYQNGPYPAADAYINLFTTPLSASLGRDFKDKEDIAAGYGMYTVDMGPWGLLAGARVEATHATYGNFLTTTDVNGNDHVTFVDRTKSYTNIFPTVQLKYRIASNFQIRATYSTGIARPGFTQAGGNAGVDFTASPRPLSTQGNPDLKPTTGNNFDLSVEYYMPNGGIVQAGLFDKEFSNYIFRHTRINVSDPIFLGQRGDIATFANESAYARGAELAYHQKFTMLPGLFNGLGVDGNVTLVDSRFLEYEAAISGSGKNEYGTLPGTSNLTWNLAGFYEAHGVALRLAAEYVSKSLFGLNGDRSLDTIQHDKLNLDFSSSYEITSHLVGYFSVKNLLDTPLRYDEGSASRPIQREIYGQTYEAGVRFKF